MSEHPREDAEEARERQGLDNKLLESRTILISQPIDDKLARSVMARLLVMEHQDAAKPITIYINSPGGSADCGFALFDMMRFISPEVRCVATGLCASAAVIIYVGATSGWRMALPNARFLVHQPSMSAFGQASDMEITAREIIKLRERAAQIIAKECGVPADKILSDAARDFWLTAAEAQAYGLVNRVIAGRKEIEG